jgi:hypothetical protein
MDCLNQQTDLKKKKVRDGKKVIGHARVRGISPLQPKAQGSKLDTAGKG